MYPGAESHFIEENFARLVVTTRHARFLDGAFPVACEEKEPKRWLLPLILIMYVLRMRPMGTLKLHTSGCFPSLRTSSWSANQSLLELLSQWSLNGSHFWTESDCGQDCESTWRHVSHDVKASFLTPFFIRSGIWLPAS